MYFRSCFTHRIATLPVALSLAMIGAFKATADIQPLDFVPLSSSPSAEGMVRPLGEDRWLLADDRGLYVIEGGERRRVRGGHLESLDTRDGILAGERSATLVAAIDGSVGGALVMLLDSADDAVLEERPIGFSEAVPDVLCLFQDPRTSHISLFVVDARGMLEQRYVYDGVTQALVDVPVRRDAGSLDATACAVHDTSGMLFIADEQLGVRRLQASEESDAVAEPWMLPAPWGELDGEAEDIAVDTAGGLWVLVPNERRIHLTGPSGALTSYSLPDKIEPTSLAVRPGATELTLAVFDEHAGQPMVATVSPTDSVDPGTGPVAKDMITAGAQTTPVQRYGDAADDPAILVASTGSAAPLILGTDKRAGLAVYDVNGEQRQFLPVGRVNNVDIVSDAELGRQTRTVSAASQRDHNSILLFDVADGRVNVAGEVATGLSEVYGLCMYHSASGVYVFINDKDGRYEQYRIDVSGDEFSGNLVREFALPSQPEGCVTDPLNGRIFMGEEAAGVWEAGAEPDGDAPKLVIPTSDALVADVEGMDLYQTADQSLLVVSSQGSDSYAVYDLRDNYRLRTSFSVTADITGGVDGVSETDGLAVTAEPLPSYPLGILVVQDGRNRMPDAPQNFKIVDWRAVQALIDREAP